MDDKKVGSLLPKLDSQRQTSDIDMNVTNLFEGLLTYPTDEQVSRFSTKLPKQVENSTDFRCNQSEKTANKDRVLALARKIWDVTAC